MCVLAYLFMCLPIYVFTYSSRNNPQRLRHDLNAYLAKIASETCKYLTICMDVQRQV